MRWGRPLIFTPGRLFCLGVVSCTYRGGSCKSQKVLLFSLQSPTQGKKERKKRKRGGCKKDRPSVLIREKRYVTKKLEKISIFCLHDDDSRKIVFSGSSAKKEEEENTRLRLGRSGFGSSDVGSRTSSSSSSSSSVLWSRDFLGIQWRRRGKGGKKNPPAMDRMGG